MARSNFVIWAFPLEKVKIVDFSETIAASVVRQKKADIREDLELASKFFSLLNLMYQTLPLKNPSDATLSSLSKLIYSRWHPR